MSILHQTFVADGKRMGPPVNEFGLFLVLNFLYKF